MAGGCEDIVAGAEGDYEDTMVVGLEERRTGADEAGGCKDVGVTGMISLV